MPNLFISLSATLASISQAPLATEEPKGGSQVISIEALLASPVQRMPRFAVDAIGDIRISDDLVKQLPETAGCKRVVSISTSLILACQDEQNRLRFWRVGEDRPAFSAEIPAPQAIVSINWSTSSSVAFVLTQENTKGGRADVLTSHENSAATKSRVLIVDVAAGRVIAQRDLIGSVLQLTPVSRTRFYYSSFDFARLPLETQIRRVDINKSRDDRVYATRGTFQTSRIAVSPDGRHLLFAVDRKNRRWDDFTSLVLVDVGSGQEVAVLSGDRAVNSGSWYGWSRDGNMIYFSARHGGYDQIVSATLSGRLANLTDDSVARRRIVASTAADMLAYEVESLTGTQEIRSLSLTTGREKTVFSMETLEPRFSLTPASQIWWKNRDGRPIAGFLFLPRGYVTGKRYPVIVDIHGGGRGQTLEMAAPLTLAAAPGPGEWYAWAALGYVVFVPDYQSSGSYGPISPRLGPCCNDGIVHEDALDVLDGIDALVEKGLIDPDKIGLLGHSAGGARVIELLAGKRRFAAAVVNETVAPDPLFNFVNMSHGRHTGIDALKLLTQGGVERPQPENLVDQATLLSAYRSGTPALIMIGNEDKGATSNLTSEVLFTLLKNSNVESRLVRFADDGHVYLTPASSRRAFEEAGQWFSRHLLVSN